MKPRVIQNIEVFPVHVPVTRTFNFASGSAGAQGSLARLVFVKVTDSEGCHGWGEGRPHPQWSYETPESVVSTLRNYLAPAVLGLDVWDRHGLHAKMHAAVGRGPSTGMPVAKAALDIAVHDLCARAAGLPLRAFLGGSAEKTEIPLSWTVAVKSPAEVGEDVAAARGEGFAHFNFKVGVGPKQDEELAKAARAHVPADSFLWMDANQGVEFPRAVRLARMLEEQGASVLEQPLPADQMHQMRRLRSQTSLPLAVDESSVSPGDYFAHAAEGLVDYFVLKLTRTGGIWPTLLQLGTALSAGHGLLVSGLSDSMVTKLAACQVAAAFGFAGPAALNGSQFLDDAVLFPGKNRVERRGTVHLDETPGLGIEPDESALRAHAWKVDY